MAISEKQRDLYSQNVKRMKKTGYIRFNLSERTARAERVSVSFSALLSIYLICSSLALYADDKLASSSDGSIVTLIGIIASISLLVANLLDKSEGRPLKSRDMHQSGLAILRTASNIEIELASDDPCAEKLEALSREYHAILDHLSENHQTWDNEIYESFENSKAARMWAKPYFYAIRIKLVAKRIISDWWLHILISSLCSLGLYIILIRAINGVL